MPYCDCGKMKNINKEHQVICETNRILDLNFHSGVASGVLLALRRKGIRFSIYAPKKIRYIFIKALAKIYYYMRYRAIVQMEWIDTHIGLLGIKINNSKPIVSFNCFGVHSRNCRNLHLYVDFMPSNYISDYLLDNSSELYRSVYLRDLRIIASARAIYFRSEFYAQFWQSRVPIANISVLPCLSNLSFLLPKPNEDTINKRRLKKNYIVLGFIGKDLQRKNLKQFLEIVRDEQRFRGIVIGCDEVTARDLYSTYLCDRVKFYGHLEKNDATADRWDEFFRSLDFGFVCPNNEAFGLQAVEFQMFGVPVITNYLGGLRTACLDKSSLAFKEDDLWKSLDEISYSEYKDMVAAGLCVWHEFSFNRVVNKLFMLGDQSPL